MTMCVEAILTETEKKIFILTTELRRWLWPLIGFLSIIIVPLGVIMWLAPMFFY